MKTLVAQSSSRLRAALRSHREFVLILVLFVAFRLSAVLVFKPGGYLGEMSDFGYYRLLLGLTNQGYWPLLDFWVEYPPVFPWLLVGLYRLSLWIPPFLEAGTWFNLFLSIVLVAVEAGNLVLLYALARRLHGDQPAVRLAWIYSALFIPVLTLFGWFEGLALFFLLLAVLLTLDRHPIACGIAAALGFMTKLVPIVALPAAWQRMGRWQERVKLTLSTALSLLLVALPFLLTAPAYLLQSLKSPVIRSTWETVWALIDGYYSYGVAGGVDRFDPAMAGAAQHPTRLPWTLITVGFVLFYLYLFTRRVDWSENRRVVAFTALSQNLLTLYFKGYSPQFLIMLLPFVLLLIPGWRGIAYVLLLSVVNLVEYPIYFLVLPDQPWVLAATVLLRTGILVVLSVEYASQVYGWRVPERRWNGLAAGAAVLVLVIGVIGSVFAFRAYSQTQYDTSPHRPAMDVLLDQAQPGATVLVSDQETYEALYPFLHRRLRVKLIETYAYLPPWEPRLADEVDSNGQLWLYGPASSPLYASLAGRYAPTSEYDLGERQLSQWELR